MASPIPPIVRVDLWELRCHFKKARYLNRLSHGEFAVKRGRPRPAHPKYRLGDGGISLAVYYYQKRLDGSEGEMLAEVHQLEKADGTLGHRKPDPKMVIHNGVMYRRIEGENDLLREPELRYKWLWQRKIYGFGRKLRCFFLGPMDHPTPVLSLVV